MMDAAIEVTSSRGEVSLHDGRMQVVFRRSYRRPIEKVWAALTVPERIEDWFGAARVDLREGGKMVFVYPGGHSVEVRINRLEAPRTLGYAWELGGVDTQVLFELTPTAAGCDLTLTHSNVPPAGGGVRAGWHAHLEGLADAIDGKPTPWAVKQERERLVAPLYPVWGQ